MSRVQFGTFSLEAGADWTLSTVILAGPVDDEPPAKGIPTTKVVPQFQRNLVATVEQVDGNVTLESYLKRQIDGLRQAGVTRKETQAPKRVKLFNGHEGLLSEQVIQGATGERVRQLQLVCIKDGI